MLKARKMNSLVRTVALNAYLDVIKSPSVVKLTEPDIFIYKLSGVSQVPASNSFNLRFINAILTLLPSHTPLKIIYLDFLSIRKEIKPFCNKQWQRYFLNCY